MPSDIPNIALQSGERAIGSVAADGFFASEHSLPISSPHVVLTDRRFVVLDRRGMFRNKRLEEVASWPLTAFTERLNSSEGSALGAGRYVLTLFAEDGETVSTGFRSPSSRDDFKGMVVTALDPILAQ